jgi:hypothetical protein
MNHYHARLTPAQSAATVARYRRTLALVREWRQAYRELRRCGFQATAAREIATIHIEGMK